MLDLLKLFKEEQGRTKKALGQHFLTNTHILDLIVSSAEIEKGDHVLEIGPGCGVLTHKLLEAGANVTAVDIDGELVSFLKRYLHVYKNFRVIHSDFMEFDTSVLETDKLKIIGNLPYNVSVDITAKCTELHSITDRMIFMYQKEVADRIAAKPCSKAYSSISVMTDYFYDKKKIKDISGGNFFPNTKVFSSILKFTPHAKADVGNEKDFLAFLRRCFTQKRKTLRNNLMGVENPEAMIEKAGLKPPIRAEEMNLDDFIRLFRIINDK
ncbi:ribosomal RNA small subunit methyltransferase A [Geovibrio thiophilus]|uniref:Ribosomal RNA small subunit methyltransferase A n=1 Tax=Geovibrio thiophilus TaxID=139438 RepID=A0A3R5V1T8_9BACT|nr:16S rRNA (adenine(1518)-N(6)/adenine(1519)-N(6))-dimethyltransferase RsmA [Geovibrio thiophilus]QAR33531.1 ribosomal RNA small subunit methyltransferase A [Geovibrio thiophilus]